MSQNDINFPINQLKPNNLKTSFEDALALIGKCFNCVLIVNKNCV